MTIPWLMNCAHSDTGWCLECVKKMGEEREALEEFLNGIGNAYGALPPYKKENTRAVGLAVNRWINYRNKRDVPHR